MVWFVMNLTVVIHLNIRLKKGKSMSNKRTLEDAIENTVGVAALLTMAPIFGGIGALTAVGFAVSATVGTGVAVMDSEENEESN